MCYIVNKLHHFKLLVSFLTKMSGTWSSYIYADCVRGCTSQIDDTEALIVRLAEAISSPGQA